MEKAQTAYASARIPNASELVGSFKLVGRATVNFTGTIIPESQYNPSGILNRDGSPSDELTFSSVTDYFGANQLLVSMQGMGSKGADQEPTEVTFPDAQAAYFGQFVYTRGQEYATNRFGHECRMVSQDNSKLLCAVRLQFDPAIIPNNWRPYNGTIVGFRGYVRR